MIRETADAHGTIEADAVVSGYDLVSLELENINYYPRRGFIEYRSEIDDNGSSYEIDGSYTNAYTVKGIGTIYFQNCLKVIESFNADFKMSLIFTFSSDIFNYDTTYDTFYVNPTIGSFVATKDSVNKNEIIIEYNGDSSSTQERLVFDFSIDISADSFPEIETNQTVFKVSVLPGEYN